MFPTTLILVVLRGEMARRLRPTMMLAMTVPTDQIPIDQMIEMI